MPRKQTEEGAVSTAPKLTAREAILDKYKDFEGIKVVSRALNNPDADSDDGIRLKDEPGYEVDPTGKNRKWHLRWVNTAEGGRWHSVINRKGFVAVKVAELQNTEEIAGLSKSEDGLVRRGDHGKEVLVKQPLELYTLRKREELDRRNRRSRNAKLVKEELANSAGQQMGDEAGETLSKEFSVEYTRHKSTVQDELGG